MISIFWQALFSHLSIGKCLQDLAVGTFLAMADKAWKEVEEDINNEEEWAKASFLASQAAHYSTVYDVWCKDMINKRVKMGMAKKMKGKKKKEG